MIYLFLPLVFVACIFMCFVILYLYIRRSVTTERNSVFLPITSGTPKLLRDCLLSPNQAIEGLDAICNYASRNNIDRIIGINRGGVLVGAYVAVRLGIPNEKLLRFSVPIIGDNIESNSSSDEFSGNILLVDDVCRTGTTLKKALSYLENNDKPPSRLLVSVLATTAERNSPIYDKLDFSYYHSNGPELKMPWHSKEANEWISRAIRQKIEQKRQKEFSEASEKSVNELNNELAAVLNFSKSA